MKRETIALAAAMLMAGAPAQADDKSSNWIRVQSLATGGSMAKDKDVSDGWIEINGWDWEVEESTAKIDGFTMKQDHKKASPSGYGEWIADVERPREQATRRVGTSDLTMKRGTSPAGSRPTPPPPPPDLDLDYDEGDTGTHEMPALPADKFGRVKVQFAWAGCVRGRRLPLVELRDARMLYRLEDVTVAGCASDGASFRYARVRRSPVSPEAR